MSFVDSKNFSSATTEQFKRFAAKAQLPTKLVLDTVDDTIERFAMEWRDPGSLCIADPLREAIDRHLRSVPLWTARG